MALDINPLENAIIIRTPVDVHGGLIEKFGFLFTRR